MPGLRGSNREPGTSARERRNANAIAMAFDDRSLGDGLKLNSSRLLQLALLATGGLEFSSGELRIKFPADGGLRTLTEGLEVDMIGMAALASPPDSALVLVESGIGGPKQKTTIGELKTLFGWTYPADGAIKNTGSVYEVDISGMAAQTTPAEGDHFLLEDSGGTDAKERITLAELRDAIIDPPADGGLRHALEAFEVDITGMVDLPTPANTDIMLVEKLFGGQKKKTTIANLKTLFAGGWTFPADGALKNAGTVYEVDISGMAAWVGGGPGSSTDSDVMLIEDTIVPDSKEKITLANLRTVMNQMLAVQTITGTDTLNASTDKVTLCNHATVAFTVMLPPNIAETWQVVKNINDAIVTLVANEADGTQEIDGGPEVVLSRDDSVTVVADGTRWWII